MPRADIARWAVGLVTVVLLGPVAAHQPITSKYTYNEHVFPVLRERCGRCHFPGGPTPMSLLTFADAAPWSEAIREQLAEAAMPPVFVDPTGPAVRHTDVLPAREIDILLTWASGGAPQGDLARVPPPPAPSADWRQGPPDLVIPVPAQTLAPGEVTAERDLLLDTGLGADRWVRLVDIRPGTASMVRSATVATEQGQVLSAWVPGDPAVMAPSGAAFRVSAHARLRVRLHYRKHWKDEQAQQTDASAIGVYFSTPPATGRALESLDVSGATPLTRPLRILAVRPAIGRPYGVVRIDAVHPEGRTPLLHLQLPRPGWDRRYWLAEPIELPAGTSIEVTASAPAEDAGEPAPPRIALDVLPL